MSYWEEALGRPRTWRHVSWLAWECLCVPSDEVEDVGGGQAASIKCMNSIHRHGHLSVQSTAVNNSCLEVLEIQPTCLRD